MKVLFISERLLWKNTGAEKVSSNLLNSLIDILGKDNVDIVSFGKNNEFMDKENNYKIFNTSNSFIIKLKNKLKYNLGGINKDNTNKILQQIGEIKYDFIFMDSSVYGKLCKKIKHMYPDVKIITFFHDITKFWVKSLINSSCSIKEKLKLYIEYPAYIYNEKESIKNSDKLITLNDRDRKLVEKEYNVLVDNSIPVTIKDNFDKQRVNCCDKVSNELKMLFVGAYYLPNIIGIKWFIDNVLPFVDGKLVIVGNGMEQIKNEIKNDNVEILGFVDDISTYYYESDCVIAPIFDGGGMKVKIAEALMYGKVIFGTSEALEGYDFINGEMGETCDTAEEFIKYINYYIRNNKISTFNKISRDAFINNYDYMLAVKKMQNIIAK